MKQTAVSLIIVVMVAQTVIAAPGDGIMFGEFTFSPYVAPSYKNDSNVGLSPDNEVSDDVWSIGYGADLIRESETLSFNLSVDGLSEDYSDVDGRDHDDFSQDLYLLLNTDGGTELTIGQAYSDVEDIDFSIGQVQEFKASLVSVDVSRRLTDKIAVGIGYGFEKREFESDTLFDWDSNTYSLKADYFLTDRTHVFVSGGLGILDSNGNSEDGDYHNAVVGIASEGTDKINYIVAVGELGVSDETLSEDISEVAYKAAADWTATDKINVRVDARRTVGPSSIERDNYDIISSVGGEVQYQMTQAVRGSLNVSLLNIDLQEPFTGNGFNQNKEEDVVVSALRLDYQAPADFLSLFLEGSITDQDSSIDGVDYTRELVSVGATLKY